MDVLVTGSSGLIGSALIPALEATGYRVLRLRRGSGAPDSLTWDPDAGVIDPARLEGLHGVVHLAGEPIAAKKWTPAQKRHILESRTCGTDLLARTLAGLDRKPAVLVSASAIGFYGDRGDEVLTEASPAGDDYLAEICHRWEAATQPAADAGIRVVRARTGIVLSMKGGALAQLLLPFRLGLGGRIGPGTQYMSWISVVDEIRALVFVLQQDGFRGPVNLTAPNPATSLEFVRAVGAALHRATVLPTPLLPLKVRYGAELVQHLLLDSQRVLPKALEDGGFEFLYPELGPALAGLLRAA